MKILHVVGKMHRGGIETLVMEIFRRIDRRKFEFHFLVFSKEEGDYDQEILSLGGKIKYVTPRRENLIKNYKEINDLIKIEHYDCIHDHLSSLSYITPLVIGKKNNVKLLVAHSHNTSQGHGLLGNILHIFNRLRIQSCCTNLMACSEDAGGWMFGKNLWNLNGLVLKNGIDINRFLYDADVRVEKRKELGFSQDTIVFGFSGRFEEQKNPIFVLQVFHEVAKILPNVVLILLGDGSLRQKMVEYIKYYELEEYVYFTGVVSNVADYLQAMDYFLFPSLFEGLGISAVEAQCADLPVFTSLNVPKEAKVLDTFIQYNLNDDSSIWGKSIWEFISEYNHVRGNVKKSVEECGYSIDDVAKELEEFYIKGRYND